jgi:lipid kinase, YegS/Rv2252/BmrU family
LILSGGDGTLSRCLSELYSKNIEFPEVAIFPTGTSNDFAKALKIEENIENWIEKITDKSAKNIDFGLINGKTVFLSSYAGGLFTKISYNTDKTLKKTFGKIAYYINGLGELTNIKTFDLDIVLDGNETIKEKAILYTILNGKSVGGFENVIDEASMNDGFMDILIVKNIDNPLDIPKILIDLMNSNLTNNDYIRTLQAKKCKIKKVAEEIDVSIDGEEGENIDVTIEFISGKLKVFC